MLAGSRYLKFDISTTHFSVNITVTSAVGPAKKQRRCLTEQDYHPLIQDSDAASFQTSVWNRLDKELKIRVWIYLNISFFLQSQVDSSDFDAPGSNGGGWGDFVLIFCHF